MDKKHLQHDAVILVCTRKDGRCFKKGAKLRARLRNELELRGLSKAVKVVPAGCLGACGKGPVVMTPHDATLWTAVKKTDVEELVATVAASLPPPRKDEA
jgi:(2Fe-2S) ferredoxin